MFLELKSKPSLLEVDPPSFYDLFNFYNLFNHGITVQDVTEIFQPQEKNIDIK